MKKKEPSALLPFHSSHHRPQLRYEQSKPDPKRASRCRRDSILLSRVIDGPFRSGNPVIDPREHQASDGTVGKPV
jgi:hypothetical protein